MLVEGIAPAATSCWPSSRVPLTYAVAATTRTASNTNAITLTSFATSSCVRPTGRIST